jgi:hypothetical protein
LQNICLKNISETQHKGEKREREAAASSSMWRIREIEKRKLAVGKRKRNTTLEISG